LYNPVLCGNKKNRLNKSALILLFFLVYLYSLMKNYLLILLFLLTSAAHLSAQTKIDDPKSQIRKKITNPEAVKEKDAEDEIDAKQKLAQQLPQKPKSLTQRAKAYIKDKAEISIPFTDKKLTLN
jgi:hypothetical protein